MEVITTMQRPSLTTDNSTDPATADNEVMYGLHIAYYEGVTCHQLTAVIVCTVD